MPPGKCRVRVTKGAEWVAATLGPGAGVTVSLRLAGKTAGAYSGEVEITVEGGAAVRVPVNLAIEAFKL